MAYLSKLDGWHPQSVCVDGNLESTHPTWVMWATHGRANNRIYLASGPLPTKPHAQELAAILNSLDVARWDHFILKHLPQLLQHWG